MNETWSFEKFSSTFKCFESYHKTLRIQKIHDSCNFHNFFVQHWNQFSSLVRTFPLLPYKCRSRVTELRLIAACDNPDLVRTSNIFTCQSAILTSASFRTDFKWFYSIKFLNELCGSVQVALIHLWLDCAFAMQENFKFVSQKQQKLKDFW